MGGSTFLPRLARVLVGRRRCERRVLGTSIITGARLGGAGRASARRVVEAGCRYVPKKPWSHMMVHGDAEMRRVTLKSVGVSGKSVRVSHSACEAAGRPNAGRA
jgi:hypothetical protein